MRKKRNQPEVAAPESKRITPVDIQQKEFRVAVRGYAMGEVDTFLDQVTEEIARLYADNKRLREEVEFGRTTRLQTGGAGEADAIVRQAREEAARVIADATARASTIGAAGAAATAVSAPTGGSASGGPGGEAMGIFLARERAFLQNMANLIQAHAEGVKQDVRRVHDQVTRPAAEPPSPPAQPGPSAREPIPAQSPGIEPAKPTQPAEPTAVGEAPGLYAGIEYAGIEAKGTDPRGGAADAAVETDRADEPTQAWGAISEEVGSATPAQHDVVDLTDEARSSRSASDSAVGDESRGGSEEAAVSAAYGGPQAPGGNRAPRVEEEDQREDRSIRELFWGED